MPKKITWFAALDVYMNVWDFIVLNKAKLYEIQLWFITLIHSFLVEFAVNAEFWLTNVGKGVWPQLINVKNRDMPFNKRRSIQWRMNLELFS